MDVDVASSSHSVCSLLELFECENEEVLRLQNSCEVESSCVDLPFKKNGQQRTAKRCM